MSAPTAPNKARKPRQPRQVHTVKPAAPLAEPMTTVAQSAVESAADPDSTVEFNGSKYKISDSVALFTLMRFARAAESGISIMDFRALAALHAFLQDCIHEDDWGRFQEDMIATKQSDLDGLLDVATRVIEKLTSRPTVPPSASSNGQPATSDGSTGASSSPGGAE